MRFSIVIPARNEAGYLAATLRGLQRQDFPGDYEVIVVDNGSTDETAEIARTWGARVISEERRGVCQARDAGTRAAHGEIVVSTDADTTHPVDWLSRIDRTFRADPRLVAVSGGCRFVGADWWGRAYPVLLFNAVGLCYRLTGWVWYVSAANLSFRRDAWTGYDLRLTQGGDELDQLRRLRRNGRVAFDATLLVDTSARRLMRGFWYSAFVTFLYYYLLGYLLNRVVGRTVLPMAPDIRPAGRSIRSNRPAAAVDRSPVRPRPRTMVAALLAVLTVFMIITPPGRMLADGVADTVHAAVSHHYRTAR
ncbi:glycosyltransferase family 2 protein [Microlunatus elymi]|nr:glycosyltransferase family A protein [Microlunatus elymi]